MCLYEFSLSPLFPRERQVGHVSASENSVTKHQYYIQLQAYKAAIFTISNFTAQKSAKLILHASN